MGIEKSTEFLTKEEVIDILQISAQTLKLWRKDGRIPYIKISPKKFVYKKEDIEAVLRRSRVNGSSGLDVILNEIPHLDKEERDRLRKALDAADAKERQAEINV